MQAVVVRAKEEELPSLLRWSGIERPEAWACSSSGWHRSALPTTGRFWHCEMPSVIVDRRHSAAVKESLRAMPREAALEDYRCFVRKLGETKPLLFSWGISGVYDFIWAQGEAKQTLGASSGVRPYLDVASWKPQIALTLGSDVLFENLWQRFGCPAGHLQLVAMKGVCSAERGDGRLMKLRTFRGGGNTVWTCFELRSETLGTELTRPNRGGAYVSVWPPFCPAEAIQKVLATWSPGYGLRFPSESCQLEAGLWCGLFGAGAADFTVGCLVGEIEICLARTFKLIGIL